MFERSHHSPQISVPSSPTLSHFSLFSRSKFKVTTGGPLKNGKPIANLRSSIIGEARVKVQSTGQWVFSYSGGGVDWVLTAAE
ncbi:hypothetical protein PM082_004268 [Marasmius tenuissimus]|nr:hypothetical protein PM082_004268 [Marasmius tenuissimus]